MPRGAYARKKTTKKKATPAKKRAKVANTKLNALRGRLPPIKRRATNPGVIDIPTISASALRTSVSAKPTPDGCNTLVTKVAGNILATATVAGDKMLEASKVRYVVVTEDLEIIDNESYSTLDQAIRAAKDTGKEFIDDTDRDGANYDIYQLVATVECERPDEVKSTVSVLGSSPA